jgi:hypothetical protein
VRGHDGTDTKPVKSRHRAIFGKNKPGFAILKKLNLVAMYTKKDCKKLKNV